MARRPQETTRPMREATSAVINIEKIWCCVSAAWPIHDFTNLKVRLEICQKDKREFKESLEFSQKDIDELKPCTAKLADIETDIGDIYDAIYILPHGQIRIFREPKPKEQHTSGWDSRGRK